MWMQMDLRIASPKKTYSLHTFVRTRREHNEILVFVPIKDFLCICSVFFSSFYQNMKSKAMQPSVVDRSVTETRKKRESN